jgi:integrase/recombinase XerD
MDSEIMPAAEAVPAAVDARKAELADALGGWLLERAPSTRTAYFRDIDLYARFARRSGFHILDTGRKQAAAWAESMRQEFKENGTRRISETTIARRLAALSSLLTYCVDTDVLEVNRVQAMRRPKRETDPSKAPYLTEDQSYAFLAAAAKATGGQRARNCALLAVMLTTGARTSEVLTARVEDLGHSGRHRVLTVTRKGGKRQSLVLAPWVADLVDAYVAGRGDGPLFAAKLHSGALGYMDEPALLRLIRRTAQKAGIPGWQRLHPHALRRSYATTAKGRGAELVDLQDSMGHADPRTTEGYIKQRDQLDRSPAHLVAVTLAGIV